MQQEAVINNEMLINGINVYLTFTGIEKELKKMANSVCSLYPLNVFGQAICSGFENTASKLAKNPDMHPLKKIGTNIMQMILNIKEHRKNFSDSFNESLKKQLGKIGRMDRRLRANKFAGKSAIYLTGEEAKLINQVFSPFYLLKKGYEKKLKFFNNAISGELKNDDLKQFLSDYPKIYSSLYGYSDIILANASALCSAILVSIDRMGRFIGENFALLSSTIFKPEVLKTSKVVPFIVSTLFLHADISKVIKKFCSNFFSWGTFYYPAVSGLVIGAYEELRKAGPPDIATGFQKDIKDVKDEWTKKDTGNFWKDILAIWSTSREQAKRYYERYDKRFEGGEKGMHNALIKNFKSGTKMLDYQRLFLGLFDGNKKTKDFLLEVRSLLLAAHTFLLGLVFSEVRFATKSYLHFTKYLGKSIIGVISSIRDASVFLESKKQDVNGGAAPGPNNQSVPATGKK